MLETNRLMIRHYYENDYQDAYEMLNDEEILKYNCLEKQTLDEVKFICKRFVDNQNEWVIVLKETGKVIGLISMNHDILRYGVNSMNLSYQLNTLYTRNGYMNEALRKLIYYYFDEVKLECISARVLGPNERSINLLLKLGFKYEGTLRHAIRAYKGIIYDDNLYSIIKKEFLGVYENGKT